MAADSLEPAMLAALLSCVTKCASNVVDVESVEADDGVLASAMAPCPIEEALLAELHPASANGAQMPMVSRKPKAWRLESPVPLLHSGF